MEKTHTQTIMIGAAKETPLHLLDGKSLTVNFPCKAAGPSSTPTSLLSDTTGAAVASCPCLCLLLAEQLCGRRRSPRGLGPQLRTASCKGKPQIRASSSTAIADLGVVLCFSKSWLSSPLEDDVKITILLFPRGNWNEKDTTMAEGGEKEENYK